MRQVVKAVIIVLDMFTSVVLLSLRSDLQSMSIGLAWPGQFGFSHQKHHHHSLVENTAMVWGNCRHV